MRGHTARPSRKIYSGTPTATPFPSALNTFETMSLRPKPARVVRKTGFAGPLIRPTGTFSQRGEEGIETLRHIPVSPHAIPEAAIGIILTIWSNMLQNEAVVCRLGGKHCAQRIAALRYFRYSESKELAIPIFVSSALLLPALLHRTDNTPPPSCQSGSRARRTSSRVGLFSFFPSLYFLMPKKAFTSRGLTRQASSDYLDGRRLSGA
ncbi:hypothetical protein GFL85_11365 [Rhizobium laguerreae]|nr:hypothetical protein [Rhizobium laguerreae]TBY05142.1 hypothetical protein E0I94_25345 [Rhizobium laguerreae]